MVLFFDSSPLTVPEAQEDATCDGTHGDYTNDDSGSYAGFVWTT